MRRSLQLPKNVNTKLRSRVVTSKNGNEGWCQKPRSHVVELYISDSSMATISVIPNALRIIATCAGILRDTNSVRPIKRNMCHSFNHLQTLPAVHTLSINDACRKQLGVARASYNVPDVCIVTVTQRSKTINPLSIWVCRNGNVRIRCEETIGIALCWHD